MPKCIPIRERKAPTLLGAVRFSVPSGRGHYVACHNCPWSHRSGSPYLQTWNRFGGALIRVLMAMLLYSAAVLGAGCGRQDGTVRGQVSEMWEPALRHPEAGAIINTVLTDWFSNLIPERLTWYYLPNLQAVGVPIDALPGHRLPEVPGVKFVGIKSRPGANLDADLVREKRGGCGIRFDSFLELSADTIRVRFTHLQYLRHEDGVMDTIDGCWVVYKVRRTSKEWIVTSYYFGS